MSGKCDVLVVASALFISALFVSDTCARREFKIGGIFDGARGGQELAFGLAVELVNNAVGPFVLTYVISEIDTDNILRTSRETCRLMEDGILGLVGPSSPRSSPHVQSICDSKEMPQVETHWYFQYYRRNGSINVHPHPPTIQNIYADLIGAWGWDRFTVIYEDDDGLRRIENFMACSTAKSEVLTLRQIDFDRDGSCRTMLNAIKRSGEEHFLVVCSVPVLEEFLKQAQQVGLVTEKQQYIIYNLDVHTANLEPYRYGGSNITGVRFLDPEDPEVLYVARSVHLRKYHHEPLLAKPTLATETALVIDAVRLFYSILEDLYYSKHPPETPLYCNSSLTRHHGYSVINDMMMKNVRGITGPLKFDAEGYRTDLRADVVELGPEGLNKVATWTSQAGLKIERTRAARDPEIDGSIRHQSFIVIIALTDPYTMVKETTHQLYGNDRFEGFGIDLIDKLSLMLGFNYTFIVQEDGNNGKFDRQTKEWDGMIGEIVKGNADMAITDLTITAEREQDVDFTLPFMNLGISILYKKPEPVPPSLFMFLSPFSGQVWLLLGAAYFLVSVSLFIMARLCPSEWVNPYPCVDEPEFLINQFSLRNSLWFTIGSLMQQGTELAPTGISTRMVAGVWWFFTLIMVSSYTANLAAFLTVVTLVTPFGNIAELANQSEISYGAKAGGATAFFFRDTKTDPTYRKVWNYMLDHPEMMTLDNTEGVRRVQKGKYAFLMESTTIEYVTERHCTLAQVGGLLVEKGYGIAMKKGWKYRAELNAAILKLQETGELTNLKIKWWKEKKGGGNCAAKSTGVTAQSLSLQNVGGVFLVLGVGSLLAFLATFIELAVHTLKRSYRHEVKFKKEMKNELRFFVKFRGMNKPQK